MRRWIPEHCCQYYTFAVDGAPFRTATPIYWERHWIGSSPARTPAYLNKLLAWLALPGNGTSGLRWVGIRVADNGGWDFFFTLNSKMYRWNTLETTPVVLFNLGVQKTFQPNSVWYAGEWVVFGTGRKPGLQNATLSATGWTLVGSKETGWRFAQAGGTCYSVTLSGDPIDWFSAKTIVNGAGQSIDTIHTLNFAGTAVPFDVHGETLWARTADFVEYDVSFRAPRESGRPVRVSCYGSYSNPPGGGGGVELMLNRYDGLNGFGTWKFKREIIPTYSNFDGNQRFVGSVSCGTEIGGYYQHEYAYANGSLPPFVRERSFAGTGAAATPFKNYPSLLTGVNLAGPNLSGPRGTELRMSPCLVGGSFAPATSRAQSLLRPFLVPEIDASLSFRLGMGALPVPLPRRDGAVVIGGCRVNLYPRGTATDPPPPATTSTPSYSPVFYARGGSPRLSNFAYEPTGQLHKFVVPNSPYSGSADEPDSPAAPALATAAVSANYVPMFNPPGGGYDGPESFSYYGPYFGPYFPPGW
jgi:hypothetical protein